MGKGTSFWVHPQPLPTCHQTQLSPEFYTVGQREYALPCSFNSKTTAKTPLPQLGKSNIFQTVSITHICALEWGRKYHSKHSVTRGRFSEICSLLPPISQGWDSRHQSGKQCPPLFFLNLGSCLRGLYPSFFSFFLIYFSQNMHKKLSIFRVRAKPELHFNYPPLCHLSYKISYENVWSPQFPLPSLAVR